MSFKVIDPLEFEDNPFRIMQDGVLVTSRAGDTINAMPVGWGGFGCFWGRQVVFMAVRPERYTFQLLEQADTFSVSLMPGDKETAETVEFLGTVSGRDRDKIRESGLTLAQEEGVPYFKEAKTVFICKKLAKPLIHEQDILPGHQIVETWYGGGFHHLFIGEILRVLVSPS